MILLGLIAMAMTLMGSPLPTLDSQTKRESSPPLNQILSGSFASSVPGGCNDSRLVLVSWNIQRGVRLSEILETFRGPLAADFYLLQEVDMRTHRTGYRNVAEEMARELRMNYVFGIEFQELAQGRPSFPAFHGQAVLSRFPMSQARLLRFRHQPHNWGPRWKPRWSWLQPRRGGRMALVVEFQLGGRPWVIYNTHLEGKGNETGRALQVREILEDIQAHYPLDTAVIVGGDLNTRKGADSPVLQALRAAGFRDAFQDYQGSLQTKIRGDGRRDWIFLRHILSFDARIPVIKISDHYPLAVRVAVPRAAEGCSSQGQPQATH